MTTVDPRGSSQFTPGGEFTSYDEVVIGDLEGRANKQPTLQEMGATGLKRAAGVIDEEFLPALRGRKSIHVYREMSTNDPMVGSLLFTITQLLRAIEWRVEAPDNSPEATKAADLIESCMDDMSHTWGDMISDILTCLTYGWSFHEVVYKRRLGMEEKDPAKKSKYNDGLIGWRKIAIRAQETHQRWVFDENGGIRGMIQLAPPMYKSVFIPIERALLFRHNPLKNNPEGVSLLRNAYRPWFFKKRLEEFEAIGVERDLAGMPVAKVPASYLQAQPGTKEYNVYAAFKKLVSNVRRDEHEGLVLPNEYDRETKQPLFEFELMSAGGSRQFDTSAIIQRYEQRILMTVLADFIMVGHEGTGSYALHVDKTGIFRAALNSIAQSIADTFNRYAIPRLLELNGIKLDELPKLVPNNVDPPDLTQLAGFMTAMGSLGMEWFPDPELEKFLRQTAHLPEIPDEMLEMRRQMALQHAVMGFADQQMQYTGMQQKAEMLAQGYTPEQAEMASQMPNEQMAAQEQVAQYKGEAMAEQDPDVAERKAAEQEAMAGEQGDPVGEHAATAQVDDERAQHDHERTLAEKDKDDQLADRQAKREQALERIRARNKPAAKPAPGRGRLPVKKSMPDGADMHVWGAAPKPKPRRKGRLKKKDD